MYVTSDPEVEARALLDRYWSGKSLPVDPVEIARALGVEVLRAELPGNVSGVLLKQVGHEPRIVVHAGDHENRRRFSVAHELGHFVQRSSAVVEDKDQYEYVDLRSPASSDGTNSDEVFANKFAAELLMPEHLVRPFSEKIRAAGALSSVFGVSIDAMSFRLRNLRLYQPAATA